MLKNNFIQPRYSEWNHNISKDFILFPVFRVFVLAVISVLIKYKYGKYFNWYSIVIV